LAPVGINLGERKSGDNYQMLDGLINGLLQATGIIWLQFLIVVVKSLRYTPLMFLTIYVDNYFKIVDKVTVKGLWKRLGTISR
jgi:hypothetical protein